MAEFVRKKDLVVGAQYKLAGTLPQGIATISRSNLVRVVSIADSAIECGGLIFEGERGSGRWFVDFGAVNFERATCGIFTEDIGFIYDADAPLNDIVESVLRGNYE